MKKLILTCSIILASQVIFGQTNSQIKSNLSSSTTQSGKTSAETAEKNKQLKNKEYTHHYKHKLITDPAVIEERKKAKAQAAGKK